MCTLLDLLEIYGEFVWIQEIGLVHLNIAIVNAFNIPFLIPNYYIRKIKKSCNTAIMI